MAATDKLGAIREKKREIDRAFKEAERLAGGGPSSIRDSQRRLMAAKSKAERDIEVRPVKDWPRRLACEADIYLFLRTYFPANRGPGLRRPKFGKEFTPDRVKMVEAIHAAAVEGRDQAIAAPRGEGKTTIIEGVTIYCIVCGLVKLPVIVAANGPDAQRILRNMKSEFERNDVLAEDFPEVCDPCRALEGSAQRANMQTVAGKRTWLRWADDQVVFGAVDASQDYEHGKRGYPASAAAGSALMTRGLDAAMRGINIFGQRPDFVILDDLDTRESAKSPTQIADRELTIEQDIAGLDSGDENIGKVILCTVMNRICLAWKYTDPSVKPSWNGQRYKLLPKLPTRDDLWEEYTHLRRDGQATKQDRKGIKAHEFYLAHRAEMDEGAEVSNQQRFRPTKEVSALQHCYNIIADRTWEHFATEYQNDPPEDEGPESSGLTAQLVASRLSGFRRRVVPPLTKALTVGLDLSDHSSHWAAVAWLEGCVGLVIDYGVLEVDGIGHGANRAAKAKAILAALHKWRGEFQADPYRHEDGSERAIDLALIDSGDGDHTTAAYQFCREMGKPYVAAKGKAPFSHGSPGQDRVVGNHWYRSRLAQDGIWLSVLDADHWKRFVHERFLTATKDEMQFFTPGSLSLFSPGEPREHHTFSHHIVAEVWQREFREGKGIKEGWYVRSKNNHYLDGCAMAAAGADMCGIRLLGQVAARSGRARGALISTPVRRPDGRAWV